MQVLPAILIIHEKISGDQRRKRRVRITADSVTVGSSRNVDLELTNLNGSFLAEVKFSENQWWIVNPTKSDSIRVNGRQISLDHPLEHEDEILIDQHIIHFEIEVLEASKKVQTYQFLPHPGSDEALWNYLLKEEEFDEIMINGANSVFVDLKGNLLKSPWSFSDNDFLFKKIKFYTKNNSGWSSWRQNRKLRIQSALPPLVEEPHVCIRKARQNVFSLNELVDLDFGSQEEIEFLKQSVLNRESIVISGATSSGKTVLMRSLVEQIPQSERLVIVEEEAETDWPHPHAVALEAGLGGIKNSVIQSLRMRPDRLIVSEIRGDEAFDFFQAINTGHAGSMTTVHANSPREALNRIENLILGGGIKSNPLHIRDQLAQAVKVVVQLSRSPDGHRHIHSIVRTGGVQNGLILLSAPVGQETSGIRLSKEQA